MVKAMRRIVRLTLLIILATILMGMPVGRVSAQTQVPDLTAKVMSSEPLRSSLELTNASSKACQVATTTQGTLAITKLMQGGKVLQPQTVDAAADEDIGYLLQSKLKTLQPGESATLELPVYKLRAGYIMRATSWSSDAGAFSTQYAIKADQPLYVELNYSLPITPRSGAPACGAVFARTISSGRSLGW
jgi:hypothetical protein